MTTSLRQRMLQGLRLVGLNERTQEADVRAVRQRTDHLHTPPDRFSESNGSMARARSRRCVPIPTCLSRDGPNRSGRLFPMRRSAVATPGRNRDGRSGSADRQSSIIRPWYPQIQP